MQESIVRARINTNLKSEATTILASMGLSVSEAIRLMLVRVTVDKTLPFNVIAPNATTIKAMEDSRRGKVEKTSLAQLAKEWQD